MANSTKRNRVHLKGTVATFKGKVDCEEVLKSYQNWGDTPKYWGDLRAYELAVACKWAMNEIKTLRKKCKISNKR